MLQNDVIKCCKIMSPHSNEPAMWRNCVSSRHFYVNSLNFSCLANWAPKFPISLLRSNLLKQESIPVGCVPPTCWGGGCLVGCESQGVSSVCVCPEGSHSRTQRQATPPPGGNDINLKCLGKYDWLQLLTTGMLFWRVLSIAALMSLVFR